MKLFMIRHGQTVANLERFYSGQSDIKLTELGKQQAKSIAPVLKDIPFDRVYTSDLSRAVETQQLALPGYTATALPCLREYDLGSLTGLDIGKAFDAYGPFNGDYTPFGGENASMMCQRLRGFLELLEKDPCDYVAAFAHNGAMKAMLQLIIGDYKKVAVDNANCNIAVFEYNNNTWRLLCWNYGAKF